MSKVQLHEAIDVLPPSLQNEVAEFVDFLRYKYRLSNPEGERSPQVLSDFIGIAPNLDAVSFEDYLTQTRSEWKEPF